MATGHQYYEADGAPLHLPADPARVAGAWQSHRTRLRSWFAGLPDDRWSAPTRCMDWNVTDIAQHLLLVTNFLTFTLHHARKRQPTTVLQGFDPQAGPAALLASAPKLSSTQLVADLEAIDARVDAVIAEMTHDDWFGPAEAPPGRVPAYLALTHMLFDSWVHERDLMVPAGEVVVTDVSEASVVIAYVVGLAGIARGVDERPPLTQRLVIKPTDADGPLEVNVGPDGVRIGLTDASAQPNASGTAADLVDIATGREPRGRLELDAAASTYLRHLASRMN